MNEHVLIVGASSPLAENTALAFRTLGHRVSLIGRSVPEQIQGFYALDLNDIAQIPAVFQRISEEQGQVTRLCFFQRFRGETDSWLGELNVSLRATHCFIKEFSRQALKSQDRSIVIVTSPADSQVIMEQSLTYHIAKAGLTQMVRYYARKLGAEKIRVNGVKPAIVLKPRAHQFYEDNPDLVKLFKSITPLGRMGLPEDVANLVLFLSGQQASFITGQIISVDGGMSLHEGASMARYAASLFSPELEDPRWDFPQD